MQNQPTNQRKAPGWGGKKKKKKSEQVVFKNIELIIYVRLLRFSVVSLKNL